MACSIDGEGVKDDPQTVLPRLPRACIRKNLSSDTASTIGFSEAAMRLGRIGFDHVAGYLQSGVQALEPRPDLVRRINRVTAAALAEQLASVEPPVVLDVRTDREWREKRIEGALNIPLNHLLERLAEVPRGRNLVVHCASGYRSSIAASLLKQHGIADVADLIGGINAWETVRMPTAAPVLGQA